MSAGDGGAVSAGNSGGTTRSATNAATLAGAQPWLLTRGAQGGPCGAAGGSAWGSQGVLAHQRARNPQQSVLWPHAGLVPGFTAPGGCCRGVLLIRADGFVKFRVRPSGRSLLCSSSCLTWGTRSDGAGGCCSHTPQHRPSAGRGAGKALQGGPWDLHAPPAPAWPFLCLQKAAASLFLNGVGVAGLDNQPGREDGESCASAHSS